MAGSVHQRVDTKTLSISRSITRRSARGIQSSTRLNEGLLREARSKARHREIEKCAHCAGI